MSYRNGCTSAGERIHLVAVLESSLVGFTSFHKLESELLNIIAELINHNIDILTIYDSSGEFGNFFISQKKLEFPKVYKTEQCATNFIYAHIQDGKLNLTTQRPSDNHQKVLRLLFLTSRHAHDALFDVNVKCSHKEYLDAWHTSSADFGKDKVVKYHMPPDGCVSQPVLHSILCKFGSSVIQLPQLVVVFRLSCFSALVNLFRALVTFPFKKHKDACKHSFKRLLDAIHKHLGSKIIRCANIVYPLGHRGVPPWFLADAEIYQYFEFSPRIFNKALQCYKNTLRKHGK